MKSREKECLDLSGNYYGAKLQALRELHHWNRTKFSEMLETSVLTIAAIERGVLFPGGALLIKIANLFNVDVMVDFRH